MKSIKKLKAEVQKILVRNDPAHDFEHIMRVYKIAEKIGKKEKANMTLVRAAVLLHDIVSYSKSDKRSKSASMASSLQAAKILKRYDYDASEIGMIT